MPPRGVLLLAVLAVAAPAPLPGQDPVWSGVERIVAVGDVHGDHDQLVRALRAARVIDASEDWIAGRTHLVQVGDVLDRGPDSRKALDLLMRLEEQAARAGGRVHALIGNHEAMVLQGDLFYLHPREAEAYGGLEELRKAMGPDGKYGRWIRGHDTVVKINDTLFVHGGISPRYAERTLREINETVRRELSGKEKPEMTVDADGPLWYRGLALASCEEELDSLLEPVLRKHAARRMVVGHTATRGEISARAGGRLVLIDVGMTRVYGGPAACLVIEKGKLFEASPAGTRELTSPREEPRSALPRLRVSDSGRFLVHEDGSPFFWLGDTAWALFEKAVLEDQDDQPSVDVYFRTRAAQGFTIVQAALVFENGRDAYGHSPFEGDPFSPRLRPGPADDFWDTASQIIDRAEASGIRLAVLPLWLVEVPPDHPMVRDPGAAYRYGRFLGLRYGKRPHLVWVLGGDPWKKETDIARPERLAMTRALAEGIADGANGEDSFDGRADYSTTLMSFHPRGGGHSSSEHLHEEPWLDFNMIQTTTCREFANYRTVERDYRKTPVKPTLDAEVAYEGSHSLGGARREPPLPRISPWDVRRAAYWNVFAGGFGHTYGHRSFIRWTRKGERLKYGADMPWWEALEAPGARQMKFLKNLILSRPFSTRLPDQSILEGDPGSGNDHVRATRAADGAYAFVYLPTGKPVRVRLEAISGGTVRAGWFNPRDGTFRPLGEQPAQGVGEFAPPTSGEGEDWILVLDDATRGFPPPGRDQPLRD